MSGDDPDYEYSAGRFPPVYLPPVIFGHHVGPQTPPPLLPTPHHHHQQQQQPLPPFHLTDPRFFAGAMYHQQQQQSRQQQLSPMDMDVATATAMTAAGDGGMSLNVHLAVPPTAAAAAVGATGGNGNNDGSHTPNTPEILNSIVSMQQQGGPFSAYSANLAMATAAEQGAAAAAAAAAAQQHLDSPAGKMPNFSSQQVRCCLSTFLRTQYTLSREHNAIFPFLPSSPWT